MIGDKCESQKYDKEDEEGQQLPVKFVSWTCNWRKHG